MQFELNGNGFEEIIDSETSQYYGNFPVENLGDRKRGFEGRREILFKKGEVVNFLRGHRSVALRFKNDTKCVGMLQDICGVSTFQLNHAMNP